MKKKHTFLFLMLLLAPACLTAADFWKIDSCGNSITWTIRSGQAHDDHIEMSGRQVSVVLRYGVDESGRFYLNKSMVWPMLRTVPNNTHASLMRRFEWDPIALLTVNGQPTREQTHSITLNGTMEVNSTLHECWGGKLKLQRVYLPSPTKPALVETYTLTNTSDRNMKVEIPAMDETIATEPTGGVDGSYLIRLTTRHARPVMLKPGERISFEASLAAYKKGQPQPAIQAAEECAERKALVAQWMGNLRLDTPDPVVNEMFAFSKIRAMESIYATKSGPMHGPGGESYYAAVWCNDQAEYINPFFPFVGYEYGNASALHSYKLFASFMNNDYRPIPSSIIAEGYDIWNGAGDRGDAAMCAYGASRYVLAKGDREEAQELWPFIEWCLEYCHRKLNPQGVVSSDTDELENRFPSGDANLCTSSLYYDALLSASSLARELGHSAAASRYTKQAATLRKSIDAFFAAQVEGFDTYRYYDGNDVLRSWICIPLCMGIYERAEGTIQALFSPRLWTENGLLSQAGTTIFWDRSTLYALRGVFMAGETEKAHRYLQSYSHTRLLGNHVPYAVEAWPEGGQRHLSAESALYARIFTEGVFGIRPTGLRSFTFSPRLPKPWNHMSLHDIKAFAHSFTIDVARKDESHLSVCVTTGGREVLKKTIKEGATVKCTLSQ
ncbi:MAG: hypothetical protein ACI4AJ_06315 [Bacteroidaceae bacterium]